MFYISPHTTPKEIEKILLGWPIILNNGTPMIKRIDGFYITAQCYFVGSACNYPGSIDAVFDGKELATTPIIKVDLETSEKHIHLNLYFESGEFRERYQIGKTRDNQQLLDFGQYLKQVDCHDTSLCIPYTTTASNSQHQTEVDQIEYSLVSDYVLSS